MKKLRKQKLKSVLLLVTVLAGTGSAHASSGKSSGIDVFAASIPDTPATESSGLSFLHDRPVLSSAGLKLDHVDHKNLAIEFQITQDEVKLINSFLDQYPDKRLAFVHEGRVLFSPMIKARLTGEGMRVSFNDRSAFEHAVQVLTQSRE